MKTAGRSVLVIFVLCVALFSDTFAQGGNSVGGHVFGGQRTPLEGITVDLLDDFSRSIGRVRTDSTGRFIFERLSYGRYKVRVLPLGTNYGEQEKEIEIQNFSRSDSRGNRITSGFDSAQVDFYLRVDDDSPILNEVIFVQDVPVESQRLYNEAVDALKQKKSSEAFAKLRAAIETYPDYFMAISVLGLEYVQAKHYEAASILLRRAVEINPKSFKAWFGLASSLQALNLDPEALKAAQNALELAPSSVHALLMTGTLLRQTAKYLESETVLTKIKKITKSPMPEVHWQLALLYGNNLQRYGDAADELEQFLKYLPKDQNPEKIKTLIKTFREKSKRT
jgi:tetratricopeptide (TPR) repeat protein